MAGLDRRSSTARTEVRSIVALTVLRSAALEFRLALFHERARAFFRILGHEDLGPDSSLDAHRLVFGEAFGFTESSQHGLHGERPVGRDRRGDLFGLR